METQSNKSRNIWIAVGVVSALCLVACVIAYFVLRQVGSQVGEAFNTDPAKVAAVSDKIAEYDLPPGYTAQMSMSIMMYDLVMIGPSQSSSNSMMIMLMQFNGNVGMSQEQMQEQVRQSFEQQSGQRGAQMTVVETRQDTIRGEQVTISISEGGSAGVKMRQLMTVFTGNGGPTVLMIQGPITDWDEDLITDFIHSIR
jgi:hypothetical protein